MTLLSREQFLTPRRPPFEDVEVAELGGTLRVQGLTGAGRDQLEQALATRGADGKMTLQVNDYRAKLLVRCLVNEDGTPLCTEQDTGFISALPATALERLKDVAERLSGIANGQREQIAGN